MKINIIFSKSDWCWQIVSRLSRETIEKCKEVLTTLTFQGNDSRTAKYRQTAYLLQRGSRKFIGDRCAISWVALQQRRGWRFTRILPPFPEISRRSAASWTNWNSPSTASSSCRESGSTTSSSGKRVHSRMVRLDWDESSTRVRLFHAVSLLAFPSILPFPPSMRA